MAHEKSFYIHAGGHRTGSSSVQLCLHENRDGIMASGFDAAYPGRDDIPSGTLGLRLPGPRHGNTLNKRFSQKVRKRIKRHSPDPRRPLILSEENLPGRMQHFFSGKFYPAAEERMRALAAGLDGRVKRVLLVVRPYEQLYISAHRKRAEEKGLRPFETMRSKLMNMDRGWPGLVQSMRDILNAEETVVVAMSARGENRNILRLLVPELEDEALVEPKKLVNLSATDAALDVLQARYHAGEVLERAQWQQVIADHAEETETTGFATFSEKESQQLAELYDRDLALLERTEGIRFIQ